MSCIWTRCLAARLLIGRSHRLSPCVRSLRFEALLLVARLHRLYCHLCCASGHARRSTTRLRSHQQSTQAAKAKTFIYMNISLSLACFPRHAAYVDYSFMYAPQWIFYKSYTLPTTLGVYRPSHHEAISSAWGLSQRVKF
jgi:hypothetical protein